MNTVSCCTPGGANFCPHCGQPLRATPYPNTPYPIFPSIPWQPPWQPPWWPGIYIGDVFPNPTQIWCSTTGSGT